MDEIINFWIILLGLLAGFFTALFGAWKDTLYEPFQIKKFVRSPIIVLFWSIILSLIYTQEPTILIVGSSVASERMTVECYKAIIRKPPSKFLSPERDSGWLLKRLREI